MHPPRAVVKREVKGILRLRVGKGFSLNEIKEVGLTIREARRLGLYVDERRKSVHEENVEALKNYVKSLRSSRKGE